MKKTLCLLVMLLTSFAVANTTMAQSTLTIKNGQFNTKKLPSAPTRDIEYIDGGVIVTYQFSDCLTFANQSSSVGVNWNIPGFTNLYDEGLPSVPTKLDIFTGPKGYIIKSEVIDTEYMDYEIQTASYLDETENTSSIEEKDFDGFYPTSIFSPVRHEFYRGRPIYRYAIIPIQYNKEENITRFYTKISYKLTYEENPLFNDISETGLASENDSSEWLPTLSENSILDRIGIPLIPVDDETSEDDGISSLAITIPEPEMTGPHIGESLLIITSSKFLEEAVRLAEWKLCLGFRTYIESLDNVPIDSIKTLIKSYYRNENLSYLLIFGDDTVIDAPIFDRYKEHELHLKNHPEDSVLYKFKSDLPYVCMDDSIGYIDTFADIHRGRILCRTTEEARTVINKIIKYESNPPTDSKFYSTGLHLAEFEGDSKGQESFRHIFTSENIKNYLYDNYFIDAGRVYSVRNESDVPKTYNPSYTFKWGIPLSIYKNSLTGEIINPDTYNYGTFTATEISELCKMPDELLDSTVWLHPIKGYGEAWNFWAKNHPSYIFYCGHGGFYGWTRPDIHVTQIEPNKALSYIKDPVMLFSITCQTGTYCHENSYIKYWITEPGGAVGAFACTSYTYLSVQYPQDETIINCIWPKSSITPLYGRYQNISDRVDSEEIYNYSHIFRRIFPDGMRMGEVLDESVNTLNYISNIDENLLKADTIVRDIYEDNEYTIHHRRISQYYGDPTMQWNISVPELIYAPTIYTEDEYTCFYYPKGVPNVTIFNTSSNQLETYKNVHTVKVKSDDVPYCVVTAHGFEKIPYIWKGSDVNLSVLDFINSIN